MPIADPTEVADCELWLAADNLVGLSDADPIASWNDESGNAQDADQATSASRPTYQTAEINGLPVVRGDGSDDELDSPLTLSQPFTVFAVLRRLDTNTRSFFGGVSGGNIDMYFVLGQVRMFAGNAEVGETAPSDGTAFKVRAVFNGGSSEIAVDDGTPVAGDAGPAGITAARLFGYGSFHFNSDIAELIVYSRVLTAGEVTDVEDYMTGKWFDAAPPATNRRRRVLICGAAA